jgi:hypothetical protein
MKKLILLALFGLFLFGCGAQEMRRGATWKNWDHFKFSAWGYKNPTAETGKLSQEQGWWGEEIPYVPAK